MSSPLFYDMEPSDNLLPNQDPYMNDDCELFLNSSCALSPNDTLSPSPNFDYESSDNDPLGLNTLLLENDMPHVPSSTLHGNNDTQSTTIRNRPNVIRVVHANDFNLSNLPAQVAVLEAGKFTSMLKSGGGTSPPHSIKSNDGPCMNRNAVNARENRQRKKHYMSELETAVASLSKENQLLKEKIASSDSVVGKLRKELCYIKNVLANESQLSNILTGVLSSCPDLKIRAPLLNSAPMDNESDDLAENHTSRGAKRKPSAQGKVLAAKRMAGANRTATVETTHRIDHSYNRSKRTPNAAGICLHLANNVVSMELCDHCSDSAQNPNRQVEHNH